LHSRTTIKETVLRTLLLSLACGAVFAQQIGSAESPQAIAPYEVDAREALEVIFSNLGPSRDDLYSTNSQAFLVEGNSVSTLTETWQAVRFTPKVDVQARVLAAAIGYVSGTRLVNLGIYTNNDITHSVGDPLPGGQGSITQIPDFGECCQLAKVTLDGQGVTLTAGTLYWLVASPDNVNAPTFEGRWHLSNFALSAGMAPPLPWQNLVGQWPAAEIRGTRLQTAKPDQAAKLPELPSSGTTIFTNLDRAGAILYLYGTGFVVAGRDSTSQPEVWGALPFRPRVDVHAKTLAAAIGYEAGTRLVNLGIYSDSGGTVGTPLPGAQGSTTDIPDSGVCCELTKVRLPGPGIALQAGVQYWLVASPDNENAPDFTGLWQHSNLAVRAYKEPEFFTPWTSLSGWWSAAEIRGTNP
jgi:hypothetical protein